VADDREQVAIDVVARRFVALLWAAANDEASAPEPEDYPALNEEQWAQIVARCGELLTQRVLSEDDFVAAYEFLTGTTP
jgi:hypothetical protein